MPSTTNPTPDRRSFLAKCLALCFAAVALAVPAAAALAAFLNPWRQKGSQGTWVRVTSLSALPEGRPQRCPIISDRTDAWNSYPAEAIGAVFLCRGKNNEVLALQSICPHNGGGLGFDLAKNCYACPVHGRSSTLTAAASTRRASALATWTHLKPKSATARSG